MTESKITNVAIAKDGNVVSGHFGHCEGFEVYQIQEGKSIGSKNLQNPGHKPGFLPAFLSENGVDVIVAGGMGARAQELFQQAGIDVIVGVRGSLDDAVQAYLAGGLVSSGSVCQEHAHADSCGGHDH